jgi:hypothetical protein
VLPKAKPAQADRQRFQLHPSVNTWRTFDPAAAIDDDSSLVNQVQSALQVCYHVVVYQALLLRCTGSLPNAAAIILVKCDRGSIVFACICRACSAASGYQEQRACSRVVSRLLTGRITWGGWASSQCKASQVHPRSRIERVQKEFFDVHNATYCLQQNACCRCPVSCLGGPV